MDNKIRRSTRLWIVKLITLCFLLGVGFSQAHAFGLFVSADPISTSSSARMLIVRTENGLKLMIQGKAATEAEDKAYWLIPMPNVINLDQDPPVIRAIDPAPLDELADLSVPSFEGACEDEPNGQIADAKQVFDNTPVDFVRALPFNAQKLSPPPNDPEGESQLHGYLSGQGLVVDEELDELIRWASDQNLMIMLIEFEERVLSEGSSPALEIDLTLPEDTGLRVALKQLTNTVMGDTTDFVFYLMGQERYRANFPTQELDLSLVSFNGEESTDYLMQFDVVSLARQSQVFITEYVGNLTPSTFSDASLAELRNQTLASKLTRLRARFIAAALRNNAETVSFRGEAGGNYERNYRVEGYMCPEPAGEEAGAESGMEAGAEAGAEAGIEAGIEAGVEAGAEAGAEAGMEAGDEVEAGEQVEAGAEVEAGEMMESESRSSDEGCQQNRPWSHSLWMSLMCMAWCVRRWAYREGERA